MTAQLALGVVNLSTHPVATQAFVDSVVSRLPGVFSQGSMGDISLSTYVSDAADYATVGSSVTSQELHQALEKITGRQRRKTKVGKIGLIIADSYEPRPDFFGLMFDGEFEPGSFDPYETTPREGCAVFMSGIAAKRHSPEDIRKELIFTAVHELGHVFNLQHSSKESFMARSALRNSPFGATANKFTDDQSNHLSQCSGSPYVWPGGSKFGDLGPLAPANAPGIGKGCATANVRLSVDMACREFWPFEPMELDILLECTSGKSVRVPDMVDPCYNEFRVWVEEPDGERRLYNPPRHYCRRSNGFTIHKGIPFERDVSLFAESGGYTFRKVGVHRIFAQFSMTPPLLSNVLEVNVLAPPKSKKFYIDSWALMSRKDVGKLLYHRSFTHGRRSGVNLVEHFCDAYQGKRSVGTLQYAVGRANAALLQKTTPDSRPAGVRKKALHNLSAAISSPDLSEHRKCRAEEVIRLLENT